MPKVRATKGHKLADTFPVGEILKDVFKKQWKLGSVIGQGGFGLIYIASNDLSSPVGDNADYVVKIEPKANGPLFCELHVYQRCCKIDIVDNWITDHKLKHLGIPRYIGSGQHTRNSKDYRFMVMKRFSTDIQKLFEAARIFQPKSVLCLGLRMLDSLEYLHEHEYVHADIKASNMLLGYSNGKTMENELVLVDYGMAYRYIVDGVHKSYKEDPKRVHDGTVEFTSRDAHRGVTPSRRGDLEILGYCLLQWLCGKLPWENKLADKNYVRDSKIKYMRNIPSLMEACSATGEAADAVSNYLSNIVKLDYEDRPDYNGLRQVLQRGITKLGFKDYWTLGLPFDIATNRSSSNTSSAKGRKRKIDVPSEDSSPPKKAAVKRGLDSHNEAAKPKVVKTKIAVPKILTAKTTDAKPKVTTPKSKIATPKSKIATPKSKITTPKSKVTTPKPATPASKIRVVTSPKATRPRRAKSPPKYTGSRSQSPALKTPTTTTTTTKRRVRRKKIDAVNASIQTTPGLVRNR